jgi:hypothetical protein
LERRKTQTLIRYRTDPVGWVNARLKEHVWSKQTEVMESLIAHRRVAVRSCHGVGKSHLASRVVAWWLDVHPPGEAFVVSTAPTFAQVRAILWRYIRQVHRKGGLRGTTNQTEWSIDGELVGYGRKPADHDESAFQGIHAKHVLVVIDEACGVPEQLWVAADALTTNPGCRILAIGNPDSAATHFAQVCQPGSLWHVIGISAHDSPNLTGESVPPELAELLISRAWVEEKAAEWGEDSPLYLAKVLGQFPTQDPNSVVRAEDIARCRHHPDRALTKDELTPIQLGVDVGGGGDLTVIRERRGILAGREWTSRSDRPEELAPMVVRAILDTGATRVKIDSIGIGWGLIGELRNRAKQGEHDADVVAVNVAEKATDPKKYVNLRSQIWWEVGRQLSADGGWCLSDDTSVRYGAIGTEHPMQNADLTCAELMQPRWELDTSGRIKIEAKDDIRKRSGGKSPDHADALLLAYYDRSGSWHREYGVVNCGCGRVYMAELHPERCPFCGQPRTPEADT